MKSKMIVKTLEYIDYIELCERKIGYIKKLFSSFTFLKKIHDVNIHINRYEIKNSYNTHIASLKRCTMLHLH